jgi:gluconate 5-dehydrogenase
VEAAAVTDELERFRLDGRVAVVSGGSGGIGVRLCAALAGVGARLVVVGRDRDRVTAALEATLADVRATLAETRQGASAPPG